TRAGHGRPVVLRPHAAGLPQRGPFEEGAGVTRLRVETEQGAGRNDGGGLRGPPRGRLDRFADRRNGTRYLPVRVHEPRGGSLRPRADGYAVRAAVTDHLNHAVSFFQGGELCAY